MLEVSILHNRHAKHQITATSGLQTYNTNQSDDRISEVKIEKTVSTSYPNGMIKHKTPRETR